uniref:Signal induced proliferation associated 1 like 1 n=1 Tax=Salmo trutta TaxID=8032 RepID=A0A674B078_SALTR
MGVRARVAEWPPRKDLGALWQVTMEADSPGLAGGGHSHLKLGHLMSPQDSSMLRNIQNTLKSKTQTASYSPDSHYLSPGDYRVPSHRNTGRIRQRSNSDITISELDGGGDSGEDLGPSGAKWSPLHREYGSTSSIDQHGASGESFFEMLKGYQGVKPDQRSPAPDRLEDLLTAGLKQASIELHEETSESQASSRVKEREKPPKRRSKSETGGESIFRKLRSVRGESDSPRAGSDAEDGRSDDGVTPLKPWVCQRGFSHYDVQSMMFDLKKVIQSRQTAAVKRKNTTTGASAAAAASTTSTVSSIQSLAYSSPTGSQEELSTGARDSPSMDCGDEQSNELLLNCPCFCNEIGATCRRRAGGGPPRQGSGGSGTLGGENSLFESSLSSHCTNAGVAVLEGPKDNPSALSDRGKHYIAEHVDLGAYYYRKFFYLREHWNYFGMDEALGPVAVSLRREKQEEHKEHGQQYNYRVIFRTSELTTLRGSILEDAVPSSSKHGTTRGLPLKEVLEYLLPELDVPCLRLALNTPKVTEQLMKLDEQGLSFQVKVGVMYCRAGQSSEEEMYNNETAGPALEEFLQLLGERVRLKGFTKYRAQLDIKTDSTGTHSLYTAYRDYEIMFHVSTMLPYTPNNKQQLLRKRHIGNDIVTIVFQEPGALPFTPKTIFSHFQHVFIIVRVHSPCSDNTCYSVAVTRSRDVPSFGPPIPKGVTFPKSSVFRDFLLAKVINAENAAHKSEKFRAMATRTRQEYLRDLAERHVTGTPVEPTGKFPFISLAHKRRERVRPYSGAELRSLGAVTWPVHAEDQVAGAERECLLAISNDFLILLDQEAKAVVFNCATRDVIGWSSGSPASMKIYYERGESVSLRSINNNTEDFGEVVKRLELLTKGSQTTEMILRRNGLGQLGFHVNFEGIVAEVESYGYAWQAGLRQGSRLVEICKVAVASLSHEQMIDLLRTSVTVKVVIIPPHEDSTPRRGCSELYHMPLVDYKNHKEGMPYEFKFPFRSNNNNKWPRTSSSPQSRTTVAGGTLIKAPASDYQDRAGVIPRSVSSDGRPLNPKRYSPGNDNYALACSIVMGRSPHTRNSPTSLSYTDTGSAGSNHWRQKSMPDGHRNIVSLAMYCCLCQSSRLYLLWSNKQEVTLWSLSLQVEASYSSSQSGSNTLSSNASSSAHSDEKWYEIGSSRTGVRPDSELIGYLQRESTDSGIDATSYGASGSGGSRAKERRAPETSPSAPDSPAPPGSSEDPAQSPPVFPSAPDSGSYTLSDAASHSSSGHSGSPMGPGCSPSSSQEESALTTSPTSQTSLSPGGPKSFYPRQGATSKFLIGWRKPGALGEIEKEYESIYSGQREPSYSGHRETPNDLLFNCSTVPRSPTARHAPPRQPSHKSLGDLCESSSQDQGGMRQQLGDPGLMPLPNSGADRALDWSNLVDAAKAFEGRQSKIEIESPACLMGKVSQLESMVKLLQDDLNKEKDTKMSLQAQIQSLREHNQRLQEESYSASAKLKKFTEWVFNTIDMN